MHHETQGLFFQPAFPSTIESTIGWRGPPWGSWKCDGQNIAKHLMLGGLDGAEYSEIWSNLLLHLKICNKVSWQNLGFIAGL